MNEQLLAYLRENRGRYTPDALRTSLLEAGYTAAEIDAAMAAVEREAGAGQPASGRAEATPAVEKPSVARSPRFWLVLVGFVVAVYGGGALLVNATQGSGLAALLVLAALVGGAVGWALLREDDRPVALGLGCGVLFSIGVPFLALGVLFGLCVAGQVPFG